MKVWHIDLNAHIKSAEQIAGRNLTHTEWQQFIGGRYRRTFGDLPDGARSEESHDVDSETISPRSPSNPKSLLDRWRERGRHSNRTGAGAQCEPSSNFLLPVVRSAEPRR